MRSFAPRIKVAITLAITVTMIIAPARVRRVKIITKG